MPAAASSLDGLNRALSRVHRSVLVLLGGCGVVVLLSAAADQLPETPRVYGYAATLVGGIAILIRPFRSGPIEKPRLHVARTLVSFVCAAGVGLIGVLVVSAGGPRMTAIAYVLAGAIFALRPPRPLVHVAVSKAGGT